VGIRASNPAAQSTQVDVATREENPLII
jgi:hypothetical protein